MSAILELSDICAEQNPDAIDQRKRLVALLKSGADIHATDKNGVTALHHAVRFNSPTAVKKLIKHGANVKEDRRRTSEAGFDYHLVKPPQPKVLESLLAKLNAPN